MFDKNTLFLSNMKTIYHLKIKGCLTTSPNQFVNLKSNTIMKNHATKVRLFFE